MPCEMCGKDAPLKTAIVEGSEMKVCPDCLEYGHEQTDAEEVTEKSKVAKGKQNRSQAKSSKKSRDVFEDTEEMLAEDYGTRVQKARQSKDLTVEELSDELNEKRSLISKVEAQDHHPRDELVTKLERKLGIELMEEVSGTHRETAGGSKSSGSVTLGDLIKEEMDED